MRSDQTAFDWTCEVPVGHRRRRLPISGRTAAARHASQSGADAVEPIRGQRMRDLLALFRTIDRLTLHDAATFLGLPVHALSSTFDHAKRDGLIEETGHFERLSVRGRSVRRQLHTMTTAGRQQIGT